MHSPRRDAEGRSSAVEATKERDGAGTPDRTPSGPSFTDRLLRLQRLAGNRAVGALAKRGLEVGPADDAFEREADRTAHSVVASIAAQRATAPPSITPVATAPSVRQPLAEDAPGAAPERRSGPPMEAADEAAILEGSGGQPLEPTIRRSMERGFGRNFGDVRVHDDRRAADVSTRIGARAFTAGSHIYMGAATPASGEEGLHTLAHELTHVVQQRSAVSGAVPAQRMPTAAAIQQESGKRSRSGIKILGGLGATTTYNNLLGDLRHYERIKRVPIATSGGELVRQVENLHEFLDAIAASCRAYTAKGSPNAAVVEICNTILGWMPAERAAIDDIAAYYGQHPAPVNPTWASQIPEDPTRYVKKTAVSTVTEEDGGNSERGQNKEVKKVKDEEGRSGFFAEDDPTGKYEDEDKYGGPKWLLERYGVTDLRLANRSIAMSRLDSLLSAGVIARTEAGLKEDKLGTFQWKASGLQMSKISDDKYPKTDPNLPRLLSRLQLIDAIAGQLDRHGGNYFVEMDKRGKVTGITGIDLDMSWVSEEGGSAGVFDVAQGSLFKRAKPGEDPRMDHYPGFSRYVDKELAERIIALRPDDLRAILAGLLDTASIDAAVTRLTQLQALLLDLKSKGKLLKPTQWTQHVRAKVLKEGKSYYSRSSR